MPSFVAEFWTQQRAVRQLECSGELDDPVNMLPSRPCSYAYPSFVVHLLVWAVGRVGLPSIGTPCWKFLDRS